jgi:hypothetical protein
MHVAAGKRLTAILRSGCISEGIAIIRTVFRLSVNSESGYAPIGLNI